ncbi:MAG: hypothetical protein QM528_00725 [Phycisphaerales bacterium]|nr:hypothetical protein [Phycisphaerales bacterium]
MGLVDLNNYNKVEQSFLDAIYPITLDTDYDPSGKVYTFVSKGPNGSITKHVEFYKGDIKMDDVDVFKLDFGDLQYDENGNIIVEMKKNKDDVEKLIRKIDYSSKSNNGDTRLIGGTLAVILADFFRRRRDLAIPSIIYCRGTTLSRTRLYQMFYSRDFERFKPYYQVFGSLENEWHPFTKGVNYEAILCGLPDDVTDDILDQNP